MTDYFIGATRKVHTGQLRVQFLGKVEIAIKLCIKSRFGILGKSKAIRGLGFSL